MLTAQSSSKYGLGARAAIQQTTGFALSALSRKKTRLGTRSAIQQNTGFALQSLSSKSLDLRYQPYPASLDLALSAQSSKKTGSTLPALSSKSRLGAQCVIQPKTGFAQLALSSKESGLGAQGGIQQKTGSALSALSSKSGLGVCGAIQEKTGFALPALSSKKSGSGAQGAIQQKTGFALSALSSKKSGLGV